MLVHAGGINRGDIPVRLYHVEESSSCVFVGSESARIMLMPEEVSDLHKLLEPFARNAENKGPWKVAIPEPQRGLLLRMPTYTPVLLGLEGRNETALTVRVDSLDSFRKPELPIQAGFVLPIRLRDVACVRPVPHSGQLGEPA